MKTVIKAGKKEGQKLTSKEVFWKETIVPTRVLIENNLLNSPIRTDILLQDDVSAALKHTEENENVITRIPTKEIPPKRGPGPVNREFIPVLEELRSILRKGIPSYESLEVAVPKVKDLKEATAMIKFHERVRALIKEEDKPYIAFFRTNSKKEKALYITSVGPADLKPAKSRGK